MKTVFTTLWLALGLALFHACTAEYIEDVDGICFERDVLPIFTSNCTQSGCHNSVDRKNGYNLSNYAGILSGVRPGDYKGSRVYQVLVTPSGDNAMPKKPYDRLSAGDIATIALWIQQGADNKSCSGGATCNAAGATYSGAVRPILQTYCLSCHSGSNPSAGINYATYNGLRGDALSGRLLGAVEHRSGFSPMPQNSPKIPACDIEKIKTWVNRGAPND